MIRYRLLIVPALLLSLLAPVLGAQRPGGPPGPPSEEEKERIRGRLGITRDQQTQIEAIFADTGRQMREIDTRMRDLYHQLYAAYDAYDFDRNQAHALRKEIAGLYRRRMALHAENEEKLRRILNRDQFDRMRAMMREMRDKHRQEW